MMDTSIIVINALSILQDLEKQYQKEMFEWGIQCISVRSKFKKKTSRSKKNGKIYESTAWYEINPDGSMKSIGKDEPDYGKFYPAEPEPAYSFKFHIYDGHVILQEKIYQENKLLFHDCLAFRLDNCSNWIHPLYRNPEKVIGDSVQAMRAISEGSQDIQEQKDCDESSVS